MSRRRAAEGREGCSREAEEAEGRAAASAAGDYESVVLDKMRRAQERARIIAQMEAEDAAEEDGEAGS